VVLTVIARVRFGFKNSMVKESIHFVTEVQFVLSPTCFHTLSLTLVQEVFDIAGAFPETAGYDLTLPLSCKLPPQNTLKFPLAPSMGPEHSPLLLCEYFAEIAVKDSRTGGLLLTVY